MKKYNTRPIDYTGCHPVIAEALKRPEDIKCRVWDNKGDVKIKVWICRYKGGSNLPYRSETDIPWKYAEPIPLKTRRVMPPERAIPVLIAGGWAFNDHGDLVCPGEIIPAISFRHFGTNLDLTEASASFWPPCIIEEMEDDE